LSSEEVRLQKVLSSAGIASRRAAEELITQGRVTVNGKAARLGQRVDAARDVVRVDGGRISTDVKKRYYALNKPEGVITTSKDPGGRTTVLDIVGTEERVVPVGRLDIATEGLILLTNDGELVHRLTHPSFEVDKTYIAEVSGLVTHETVRTLTGPGVRIEAGRPAKASKARVLQVSKSAGGRTVMELTLHEGRRHVVRRMLAEAGHPVLRLVRTGVGPISLGRLKPGDYRTLSPAEVTALFKTVGL